MKEHINVIALVSFFGILLGTTAHAQGLLPTGVASECSGGDIIGCVISIYQFGVLAVAILAFVVLVWGGFIWLTSGGNVSRVDNAKQWIMGSILGLVIALGSFILLNTINPQLTTNLKTTITIFEAPPESKSPTSGSTAKWEIAGCQLGGIVQKPPPSKCGGTPRTSPSQVCCSY